MRFSAPLFLVLAHLLPAAALVPVPSLKQPPSVSAIQPNRGQGAPGILFQTRGSLSVAAQGASLLFSPSGTVQNLVAGNSNPQVSFSDPLPGVSHDYSTADANRWITNIPRYATARIMAMYPGIDVEYNFDPSGKFMLRLLVAPNADLSQVVFELPGAVSLRVDAPSRTAIAQFVEFKFGPILTWSAVSSTPINIEQLSTKTFRFTAPSRDPGTALRVDVPITVPTVWEFPISSRFSSDTQSNLWTAVKIPDAAGKPDPFPTLIGNGCGLNVASPFACNDVAVYKFSPAGEVLSVTFLSGGVDESPAFLGTAPDGTVVVTGNTDSSDFPTSTGAFQSAYAGPPALSGGYAGQDASGDYFAARLDPATGTLRASTYFGGPNADTIGETAITSDGSIYFLHKQLNGDLIGMPTSPGALMLQCADVSSGTPNVCLNGYVAHLSSNLDQLLYGTYVPGLILPTIRLHSDGSVYFIGQSSPSFQPSRGAFQTKLNGPTDGIIGRLDPSGSRLLFATYLGGPGD
jgi:hypothetical protein